MHLTFPSMSDHGVSPTLGFLPLEAPLKSLPSYFNAWDCLASNIPTAIAAKSLRSDIARLPVLSASKLTNQAQLHRAFVVLGFLVHAYIWCDGSDRPEPSVPAQLGEPYVDVCEILGMQPTLSYAGLCLWNWQINTGERINGETTNGYIKPDSDINMALANLDNLECLVSFTGTRDEAVFYLVPVMVEALGGRLIKPLLKAAEAAVHNGDPAGIIQALQETKDTLPRMSALIKLLHEQCNPKTFYQKVRPFYPGAKGMEAKGMADGVVFQRSDGTKVNARCVGGSAAQSSLFPFIDSALGVKHRPVGGDQGETVFQEMASYMPLQHRAFLNDMAKLPSLREYIESRPDNVRLVDAYNGCLEQLSSWRSRHIGVVTTHIVTQSRNKKPEGKRPDPEEVTDGLSVVDESKLQGTGGSALIPFLKQAKKETLDSRI